MSDLASDDLELISKVHRYSGACSASAPRLYLVSLLESIMDLTVVHFRQEEGLMHHLSYPAYVMHCVEHKKILGSVLQRLQDLRAGGDSTGVQSSDDLEYQFRVHVTRSDVVFDRFRSDRLQSAR